MDTGPEDLWVDSDTEETHQNWSIKTTPKEWLESARRKPKSQQNDDEKDEGLTNRFLTVSTAENLNKLQKGTHVLVPVDSAKDDEECASPNYKRLKIGD